MNGRDGEQREKLGDPLAFGAIKYDDVADYAAVLIYSFGTR